MAVIGNRIFLPLDACKKMLLAGTRIRVARPRTDRSRDCQPSRHDAGAVPNTLKGIASGPPGVLEEDNDSCPIDQGGFLGKGGQSTGSVFFTYFGIMGRESIGRNSTAA